MTLSTFYILYVSTYVRWLVFYSCLGSLTLNDALFNIISRETTELALAQNEAMA